MNVPSNKIPLGWSERKLLLFVVDFLILTISLYGSLYFRSVDYYGIFDIVDRIIWFTILACVWITIATLFNLYDLFLASNTWKSVFSAVGATLLATFIYMFIPFFTPIFPESRSEALSFPFISAVGIGLWRLIYSWFCVYSVFQKTAIVIGATEAGQALVKEIQRMGRMHQGAYQSTCYHVMGYIDDNHPPAEVIAGVPVLGNTENLASLVEKYCPNDIIVALSHSLNKKIFQGILDCREMGYSVTTMASMYEQITGKVPVEHAGRDLSVVMPLQQGPYYRMYNVIRNIVDVFIGLIGCFLTLLICPWIWLANKLYSPGPMFYIHTRVGKSGKPYQMVKFRSMIVDAEKGGAVWAQENDTRITKVGHFLRKTRLDEFPQFWNILKGEMSIIGPRPERPEFIEELSEQIPCYRSRHAEKPGLTGWAQTLYRYGSSVEDSLIKLQYDLYYIKNKGFYVDFLIVLNTIKVMLGMKGR